MDDGPGLPDEDPVGLLLDDVPNMVFVVPALALAELRRAAEDEADRELGPPVGEDVVAEDAAEEAALAAANPTRFLSISNTV